MDSVRPAIVPHRHFFGILLIGSPSVSCNNSSLTIYARRLGKIILFGTQMLIVVQS